MGRGNGAISQPAAIAQISATKAGAAASATASSGSASPSRFNYLTERRPIARGRQRAVCCDWSDGCGAEERSDSAPPRRVALRQTPRHRSDTPHVRPALTQHSNFQIDNFLGCSLELSGRQRNPPDSRPQPMVPHDDVTFAAVSLPSALVRYRIILKLV